MNGPPSISVDCAIGVPQVVFLACSLLLQLILEYMLTNYIHSSVLLTGEEAPKLN